MCVCRYSVLFYDGYLCLSEGDEDVAELRVRMRVGKWVGAIISMVCFLYTAWKGVRLLLQLDSGTLGNRNRHMND